MAVLSQGVQGPFSFGGRKKTRVGFLRGLFTGCLLRPLTKGRSYGPSEAQAVSPKPWDPVKTRPRNQTASRPDFRHTKLQRGWKKGANFFLKSILGEPSQPKGFWQVSPNKGRLSPPLPGTLTQMSSGRGQKRGALVWLLQLQRKKGTLTGKKKKSKQSRKKELQPPSCNWAKHSPPKKKK